MQGDSPTSAPERYRDPIVSGIFYPDDPEELKSSVDGLLKNVGRIRMDALAVLCPHASLPYAGAVQAKALSAARSRRIDNIVVLSPRHKPGEPLVFLPESDYFCTPFGKLRVARELLSDIESCGTLFASDDIPHLEEHAIEVQLPFASRLFPDASIVPLILGSPSRAVARSVSRALELVFADRLETTLFLVSTNLSSHAVPEEAKKASIQFLKEAGKLDGERILESVRLPGAPCGAHCLAALVSCSFMRGRKAETLLIQDSTSTRAATPSFPFQGEPASTGEDAVVYAAMAFY